MHVAGPPRHRYVLDDFVALGIDNENIVALLVADIDQPGVLSRRWRDGKRRAEQQAERYDQSKHCTTLDCFRPMLRSPGWQRKLLPSQSPRRVLAYSPRLPDRRFPF